MTKKRIYVYTASGSRWIFPREMGKRLGRLKQERENSDYDDFYVASLKDASDQYKSAKLIIEKIEEYLSEKGIQY